MRACRYHYRNNTGQNPGASRVPGSMVWETPERVFHRTDGHSAESLWHQKILAHEPVPCDRSYQHSDLPACSTNDLRSPVLTSGARRAAARSLNATRTWISRAGKWHARFCALKQDAWFLSPYSSRDGLKAAPREIQRCSRFRVCPSIAFAVRGQVVPRRRVLVWKKDETTPEEYTRHHCSLDAARCGSFGQMVQHEGNDCLDAAKHSACRVDRLTSPLISIVFSDGLEREITTGTSQQDDALLAELRKHCPYAFTERIDGLVGEDLFSTIRETMAMEYDSVDLEATKKVHRMANALVFAVFGVGSAASTRGLSAERYAHDARESPRDTPFDVYIKQGNCARYVAARMKDLQTRYSGPDFNGLDYEVAENDYVSPGTSLYLFAERVAIFVPIRWLMQCVVWAGSDEGGVSADFVGVVVDGRIVEDSEAAFCRNWQASFENNVHLQVTLKVRLLTARMIFAVTKNEEWLFTDDRQIVRDVHTAVVWALDQIGARDRPDLWCLSLSENEPNQDILDGDPAGVFALSNVNVIRSSFFEMSDTVLTEEEIEKLARGPVPDMHSRVRSFLVGDKQFMQLTNGELIREGLVKVRSARLSDSVQGNEIRWPMYEFRMLQNKDMSEWIKEHLPITAPPTLEGYLSADPGPCGPDKKMLKSPEYSLRGSALQKCQDFQKDLFVCETLEAAVYDHAHRVNQKQPFLRSDELLVLVLKLLKRAMYNSNIGEFADLHIPHTREENGVWDGILDLFGDGALGNTEDPLGLAQANRVEVMMKTLSESGVECAPNNEIEGQNSITNTQHLDLRECVEELREEVGWVVHAKQEVPQTLEIPVTAAMLLAGFYPAFAQLSPYEDPEDGTGEDFRAEHFLRDLFDGNPGVPIDGESEAICFSNEDRDVLGAGTDDGKLVYVMTPFWGDFFDVARTGSSAVGSLASAQGCDMKRSGPENSLLVFHTLCPSTPASGKEVCDQHPHYLKELRNNLPPACEELDGEPVYRAEIGAVRGTPLCERRPRVSDTECGRAHGLLHGRKGTPVADLDHVESVDGTKTQRGLWNSRNSLFRANEAEAFTLSEGATALQLSPHDIGGHRLAFRVSAGGVLRLESASMRSDPKDAIVPDVRTWLAHVEDDFAEHQLQYEFVNGVAESEGSSWRCPLHWMQTFVTDNGFDQARAPVPTRNAARFEHITGVANRYAHPTVRSSVKIQRLQQARFLNDGLACVGKGSECHGGGLLAASLESLLGSQQAWRIVEYVGNERCDRVLDWPEEHVNVRL